MARRKWGRLSQNVRSSACERCALLLRTLDDDDEKEVQIGDSVEASSAVSFAKPGEKNPSGE